VQGYYKGVPCTPESIVYRQLAAPPASLTLSLTNPPGTGDGSAGNPYIADVSTSYVLFLTHSAYGNVSTGADTTYTVSNTAAGAISNVDATLNIDDALAVTSP
jgi:hypothetical protein